MLTQKELDSEIRDLLQELSFTLVLLKYQIGDCSYEHSGIYADECPHR